MKNKIYKKVCFKTYLFILSILVFFISINNFKKTILILKLKFQYLYEKDENMKIKSLVFVIVFTTIITFFNITLFATNDFKDAGNSMMNMVDNAGQAIEDTAQGIGTGIKDGSEYVGNTITNMGGAVMDMTGMDDNQPTTNNNYSDYTAEKTATTVSGSNSFFGIDPNILTWTIMGIVGVSTVALVWYYGKEHEYTHNHTNNDNY